MSGNKFLVLALALLLFSAFAQARVEYTPPEGFIDQLESLIVDSWQETVSTGWSEEYDCPRTEFNSGDATNYVLLENVGLFLRGAAALKGSGLVSDAEIDAKIASAADQALNWQWVPAGTAWGAADNVSFPVGGTSHVIASTAGVVGANNECKGASVSFNEWFFVKSSRATQDTTSGTAAAMASGLLAASALNAGNHGNYSTAGRNLAANLTETMVSADGESFGVNQNLLTYESLDSRVPTGMFPGELKLYGTADTDNCSDGAFVKFQRGYKHEAALAAQAFALMSGLTGEGKYETALNEIVDGVLGLRECDGFIHSYFRVHTPAAADTTCRPIGEDNYDAYPSYLVTDSEMESSYDTIVTLYYLHEAVPRIYSENASFKDSLDWLEQIESQYTGTGMQRKEGFMVRHNAAVINLERKGEAQAMLAAMFARAACQIKNDDELKESYFATAVQTAEAAFDSALTSFPKKPVNAFSKKPGANMLALKALNEVRQIFTVGCSTAPDLDEDGFYNDPAEGDYFDCNDTNSEIFPFAAESCNLVDDDCDGTVDEGFDEDDDGYSTCQGDCRDDNAEVNPGAAEKPDNQRDDNCNRKVDEKTYLVSSLNEAEEKLVDLNVLFYLHDCAKDYAGNLNRVKSNCGLFAQCVTSKVGVCSLSLEPKEFEIFFEDDVNGMTALTVNLRQLASTTIDLRKPLSVDVNVVEEAPPADANVSSAPAFTFDFSSILGGDQSGLIIILIVVLGIILILVAVIVVLVLVYLIKFKGKGGGQQTKLGSFLKPQPKQEKNPLGFDGIK